MKVAAPITQQPALPALSLGRAIGRISAAAFVALVALASLGVVLHQPSSTEDCVSDICGR